MRIGTRIASKERILELSSRYYELVPRGAGTTEVARPIENDANLAKEFEQLLNLTEALNKESSDSENLKIFENIYDNFLNIFENA